MDTTRGHILKSAVELFSEKGFEQTTVRDICTHADANVAAVNYHFKGKTGLGESVLEFLFENVKEQQRNFPEKKEIKNEKDWKKAIYEFIYNFISDRDREEYRNYYRSQLIFKELNTPSALFEKMYSNYMAPFQKQLMEYISMGLPEGASDEDVSIWVITVMSQCVMFRKKSVANMEIAQIDFSKPEKVEKVAHHIADTLFCKLKFRKKD